MDNLFNLIFKATNVEPSYDKSLCLAAGKSTSCTKCREACPHDAITIRREVKIDEVDCSGCGLCVQACPTQALEPKVSYDSGASLRCSRVKGSGQSILCLGRLQPSDLLRLVGSKEGVTLARGDCASCPIGSATVATAVAAVREQALELAELHDREVTIVVVETDEFDADDRGDTLSRRQLLRGGWRSLAERAGAALAPLDPGPLPGEDGHGLPVELRRRYRIVSAAQPEPQALVPWALPRVADICIMCPACVNACPTGALDRVFEENGQGVLQLNPEECVGCGACVEVCPVGAVTMDENVTWQELSGGKQEAYRRNPEREHPGSFAR